MFQIAVLTLDCRRGTLLDLTQNVLGDLTHAHHVMATYRPTKSYSKHEQWTTLGVYVCLSLCLERSFEPAFAQELSFIHVNDSSWLDLKQPVQRTLQRVVFLNCLPRAMTSILLAYLAQGMKRVNLASPINTSSQLSYKGYNVHIIKQATKQATILTTVNLV